MEELIEKFIVYMQDVGFIKSKSEIFILKRRYTLVMKQAKEQGELESKLQEDVSTYFLNWTRSILTDFFEERTEDVVSGILERWTAKTDDEAKNRQQIHYLKTNLMINALSRFERNIEFIALKQSFDALKENLKLSKQEKIEKNINDEREHRIVAEASLSALQIELKEALDRIAKMEK